MYALSGDTNKPGVELRRDFYARRKDSGGRSLQPQYQKIVTLLKKYGTVTTDHIAEDTLPHQGETELTEKSSLSLSWRGYLY